MTKQKSTEDKESNKGSFKDRYKICLSELNKIPTVKIKNKKYSIVAERFRHLKKYFPESKIDEQLLFHDDKRVITKTTLYIGDQPYAVGHSEEFRNSSNVNQTSAIENSFTSSLGRCLAAFGLAGSEYASAEEVANAIANQNKPIVANTNQVSIMSKINQQTTQTKLNKLYSDWKTDNDNVEKSFKDKAKTIETNGGQHGKSNW
jgi:hypothetical protein|tara:strand:- start:52 stop:663 length:612 start_codon:yes stop_codon:yes gene_type:complete